LIISYPVLSQVGYDNTIIRQEMKMKHQYQLYSIAGDPMSIFEVMSARKANQRNRENLQKNSIFEWVREKPLAVPCKPPVINGIIDEFAIEIV
jgi:hypothetical protein